MTSAPDLSVKVTRPTSIRRLLPLRKTRTADLGSAAISSVRLKSPPVPLGRIPSSVSLPDSSMPFATSEMVPSPPQATTKRVPFSAARLAITVASLASRVNSTLNGPKPLLRSLASWGHILLVVPLADAGLTMTKGSGMSNSRPESDWVQTKLLEFGLFHLILQFSTLCDRRLIYECEVDPVV